MADRKIDLVAILTPKPGQIERVSCDTSFSLSPCNYLPELTSVTSSLRYSTNVPNMPKSMSRTL